MAGGQYYRQGGFSPGGPPMQGGEYMNGSQQLAKPSWGGWGGDYGFAPKTGSQGAGPLKPGGPTQWAGPNAYYPNWGDDPNAPFANDVALMYGGPWTGGGGGFGPGLMGGGDEYGWETFDGPGSGMWGEADYGYEDAYGEPEYEEEAVVEAPFNWGSVGGGRLTKAKEYAALGMMGKAKQVFTSGTKGGTWSPEIAQQLRTFKTGG